MAVFMSKERRRWEVHVWVCQIDAEILLEFALCVRFILVNMQFAAYWLLFLTYITFSSTWNYSSMHLLHFSTTPLTKIILEDGLLLFYCSSILFIFATFLSLLMIFIVKLVLTWIDYGLIWNCQFIIRLNDSFIQ